MQFQPPFDMGTLPTDNYMDPNVGSFPSAAYTDATGTRPSTSPSPAPTSEHQKQTHSHSQSESFTSASLSAQPNTSQTQTRSTSPVVTSPTSTHSNHPAHPGPISLPPPPPVSAFPVPPPHTLSPYHPPVSPYGPPIHHPGMMIGMMGMPTPHGLPPITPSMPPFTFLPQPSPGPAPTDPAQQPSPSTGTAESHPQGPGSFVAHLHHAHGAMLSPYTPFSPGVAISPGAFWGRPGSGANPYINPAVGAPVHSGYFPPVPPRGQPTEEYFPPFLPQSTSTAASRPSGLANEIQMDQSSVGGSADDRDAAGAPFTNVSPPSAPTSEGHSTATTTGTEVSPRAPTPSSRGTSYANSNGPSSSCDLAQEMAGLAISQAAADEKPRSQSTGAQDGHAPHQGAPFVRADSDPVQGTSAMNEPPVEARAVEAS